MSLIQRLAEIRELQGKEPMPDPSRIDGFGASASPPPAWSPPTQTNHDEFEDPEDEELLGEINAARTSPLVRAAMPEKPQPPQIPLPDFAILESEAAYLGRTVSLNDSETRQVKAIVVRALQRDLRGQMSALKAMEPRRARKAKPAQPRLPKSIEVQGPTGPPTVIHDPETIAAVMAGAPKRKRGRPRGSLIK